MPFFATDTLRLQPYLGHRSAARLRISARALRQDQADFAAQTRLSGIRTMLSQFVSHESEGIRVTLTMRGGDGAVLLSHDLISDSEGFVHFDVPIAPELALPDTPAWEAVELAWESDQRLQTIEARVLAPGAGSQLGIISDIDDTIMESGITGGMKNLLRNWDRVLAQMPEQRLMAPGVSDFYKQLGGGGALDDGPDHAPRFAATHHPFFYISSSPWNLFSYLVSFMRAKSLPIGPIALRDWGPNRQTFGHASHAAHKRAAIDSILGSYPEMQFALVGDDTQGDLPAFADAVQTYPGRIAAVFLRKIAQEPLNPEELAACEHIKAAGVPLWTGEHYADSAQFLARLDLGNDEEARKLVELVEHPATAAG